MVVQVPNWNRKGVELSFSSYAIISIFIIPFMFFPLLIMIIICCYIEEVINCVHLVFVVVVVLEVFSKINHPIINSYNSIS